MFGRAPSSLPVGGILPTFPSGLTNPSSGQGSTGASAVSQLDETVTVQTLINQNAIIDRAKVFVKQNPVIALVIVGGGLWFLFKKK